MNNYVLANSFCFRQFNFTNSHHANLLHGTKYNHIAYLKQGSAEIIGDNFQITLNEGDLLFIPRGSKYRSHWQGSPCVIYNSYSFTNYPSTVTKTYTVQKIRPDATLLDFIEKLPTDNTINCQTVGTFFLFLDELFKTLQYSGNGKNQLVLENAMNKIRLNPNMSIPEVAQSCNISVSSLYLLFRTHINCTPSKYKLNMKLEQALHYLITTDMPIEEISDLCGFSSSSYFRKNFYKQYNKTPREARKNSIQQ